ncbi:Uncharacterized metalloprotease yggG [Moraxella lacunata]|uniref:Uncharacterized metalloprotease yggG n=1 Tax=Moraxella lacunata TaxID=477 RepID=A0A378QKE2_MORLA|nr:M48 family metallopeptidase [Moraxella lacunata]STZ00940.1 Uncharacterized metalloprotease yggG [Moraxella lacunata]
MSTRPITVRYFDGKTSKAHTAHIRPSTSPDSFVLEGDGFGGAYRTADCEFMPSVGRSAGVLAFGSGERIELIGGVPDWLELHHKRLFHKISIMESSFGWILVSLVAVVIFMTGVLKFGVPLASHHIAQSLPPDVLMEVGQKAEEQVMELTEPSKLSQARQDAIIALYDKLDGNPKAKVLVRGGGVIGANALAIPNNTIAITDELIELSGDDNEILAVLAHEQGHLVHRHSLERAISSIGVGVLVIVITGDASDLILALPTMLAAAQYSQDAEMQADKFAIDELKRLGISPMHLANFFEKLKKEHGDGQGHWSVLSTHPETDKRIEQVKKHSE